MTTLQFAVTPADTAEALGSGDVPVLATPRLLAWMEAATVASASGRLDADRTSVGVEVTMAHLRASAVGAQVEVEVSDVLEEGRTLAFGVVAREVGGPTLATARIVRAVVSREGFLARL